MLSLLEFEYDFKVAFMRRREKFPKTQAQMKKVQTQKLILRENVEK